MLSGHRFCCYMCLPNALLLRGLHILPTILFITLVYIDFLSVHSIGLHSAVDILVDFDPCIPGSNLGNCVIFFFYYFFYFFSFMFFVYLFIITVQIQHYCLYSDSPTLLPLMMAKPPAPSAL